MSTQRFTLPGLLLLAFGALAPTLVNAQAPTMPLPAHSSTYAIYARGFWFQAPTDFTIVGLRVPIEITTPQAIQLVSMPGAPTTSTAGQTNFTVLHYSNSTATGQVIPVNIPIASGTYIGGLFSGFQDASNDQTSYASGPYNSAVGAFPCVLQRFGYQGQICTTQCPTVWGVAPNGGGSIGRGEIYYQIGPSLGVMSISSAPQSVFANAQGPGSSGVVAGEFTVGSNTMTGGVLTSIDVQAGGTGADDADYSSVELFRDSNANNVFDTGTDVQIGATATAFPSDDGTITFNVQAGAEQDWGISETRRYFIVVKLAGSALPGTTFTYSINDIGVGASTGKTGIPSAVMDGLIISTPLFTFTDISSPIPEHVLVGSSGNVAQVFTLEYANGPDDKPANISITGLGTADEANDLADVELWLDDGNGTFEDTIDTMISNSTFSADDGFATFDLTALPVFQVAQPRTFFVIYDLNVNPLHGETFQCYVSAMAGATFGGIDTGIPAPSTSGNAGLIVEATTLTATFNGPSAAINVENNSAGSTGNGELLLDFTLTAGSGQDWPITELTFAASGTAPHDLAYFDIALYEDTGNGTWDGSGTDGAAAGFLPGFGPAPGYLATFQMSNGIVFSGQSRRFFLVGRLSGVATTGQTLNARLEAMIGNLPAGGLVSGFPSVDSTALVVDASVLTVAQAPGSPGDFLRKAGSATTFTIARFQFTAGNDVVSISGVTLTGSGTGNWANDLDSATGVSVYLEDGDGLFNQATDTLVAQGAGAASMNLVFSSNLDVPTRESRDIWVVVNMLASAGVGSASPLSYTPSIVQDTDVAANAMVVLGTPAPMGATLSVVDFFVTSMTPLSDFPAGGKQITITGSGFIAPVMVTIDGVICPGTPIVTPTQVTGIEVPPGSGTGLQITVTSGTLAPLTMSDTFDYVAPPSQDSGSSSSGGCTAGAGLGMLAVPALLVALRRRRK